MSYITYHVFTNGQDEWFRKGRKGEGFKAAFALYKRWKAEYGAARIYEEERDEDDEVIDENCIRDFGPFPY